MKRTLLAVAAFAAAASATAGDFVRVRGQRAVRDCYIVVLKPGAAVKAGGAVAGLTASQLAIGAAARYGGRTTHVYEHALSGYSICMPEAAAEALAQDPAVELVEQDQVMTADVTQTNATWGSTASTSGTCR